MKRGSILILAFIVVIALVACGCSSSSTTTSTATDSPESALESENGSATAAAAADYTVVDTGQSKCYDNSEEITPPELDQAFYGQDAQFDGIQPAYQDNGDGTVTDLNTGLMWQQDPGEKKTYDEAVAGAETFNLAGYDDWRLPSIKELYSLILFSGIDPPPEGSSTSSLVPFIDTDYFDFEYGDTSTGERIIDSQWISSTEYVGTTMGGAHTVFGVNFADGRIKGYGTGPMPGQSKGKGFFVIYVRGNDAYGENSFTDNGNGTITDNATGLMWSQDDSGQGLNWEEALAWVEQKNAENYLGFSDWRLPNAKELQSIVDYSRSPDTTSSAAIDPVFNCTSITNEAGQPDYPFFWTGTTHASTQGGGAAAAYISFGRAMGYMQGQWMDVHGAGAQRSDPKVGDPADYPEGRGPQGDAIRIYDYVRLVRDTGDGGGGSGSSPTSRQAAHDSIGVTQPSTTWYLAEGATDGGFETWVLIQNPDDSPAQVSLTFMTEYGEVAGPDLNMAPVSRQSVNVGDYVETYHVSTMVSSDQPVISERAMYHNDRTCAHDSIGVTEPASTWYLAEGATDTGFETWVLIQNPDDSPAQVRLTFMTEYGEVAGPDLNMAPASRQSVNVGDYVETYHVSTMVSSDQPVIAERAMYYGQ